MFELSDLFLAESVLVGTAGSGSVQQFLGTYANNTIPGDLPPKHQNTLK